MKKTRKKQKGFSPAVKKGGKIRFAENMIPVWITVGIGAILTILTFCGKYITQLGTTIWKFVQKYNSEIILIVVTWTIACIFCTVFEMYRDKKAEKAEAKVKEETEEETEEEYEI